MKQILFVLALFLSTEAYALSDNEIMARLANISTQDEILNRTATIFAHDEKQMTGCAELSKPKPLAITVFEMPVFNGDMLSEGTWQMRYDLKVCGKERRRTMLFQVKNAEDLNMTSLLPGDTLADMTLQADVRNSFFMGSFKLAPECKSPHITHTQVIKAPADKMSQWQEIWTADFCGKKIAQTIDFTPNEEGTVFTMTAIK